MLMIRRLIKKTDFLMARERRKRMMPRHLLAAAVLTNIIPFNALNTSDYKNEELNRIAAMLNKEKKPRVPRPPGAARV